MVRVGWLNEENGKIIEIKKKYESDYPDIKNIFNLREVLDFFLCNNVKLSKQDKSISQKLLKLLLQLEQGCQIYAY
jgi:hypothetical protein